MKEYERTGVLTLKDLRLPTEKQLKKGVALIECIQEIPCNPCVDICPFGAITMKDINAPPIVDYDKCTSCRKCVEICPGLAIFVIQNKDGKSLITLQYEFLPVPEVGSRVKALDRMGKNIGIAVVKKVIHKKKTMVVTIEVKENLAMDVRNIKV